jgi:hypothetical protein
MDHSKIYDKYNSDSGDQDLSTEKIMPISTSFDYVLNFIKPPLAVLENQIAEGDKLCNSIGCNINSKT